MQQHYVYKITNLINLKIYIGVHATNKVDDDKYMGSGKAIKAAIKKYGIENFKKEIIAVLDSIEEAFKLESEIVNEEFVARSDTYNLVIGGAGPNTWLSRIKLSEAQTGKKASEETRRKMSEAHKNPSIEIRKKLSETAKGRVWSDESRRKLSESHKGKKFSDEHKANIGKASANRSKEILKRISDSHRGKPLSEEHKLKISLASKNCSK